MVSSLWAGSFDGSVIEPMDHCFEVKQFILTLLHNSLCVCGDVLCNCRVVIKGYFDEKGLVRQQLDSFDEFISNTILEVITEDTPPIILNPAPQYGPGAVTSDVSPTTCMGRRGAVVTVFSLPSCSRDMKSLSAM
jgi:hypothetical protein